MNKAVTIRVLFKSEGFLATALLALVFLTACAKSPMPAPPAIVQAPSLSQRVGSSSIAHEDTVESVSIDLVIHSAHHGPVPDVDSSELTVTDDGTPIQLTSLRRVNPASGSQNHIAFIFDPISRTATTSARRTAEKILGVIPDQGYSLAVLQIGSRLSLLQSYTHDFHLADIALVQATSSSAEGSKAGFTSAEQQLTASVRNDAATLNTADRSERTTLLFALEQSQRNSQERPGHHSLSALQSFVQSSKPLTGRKFIFYFTNGVAGSSDAREQFQSIVSLADRIGVTIFVIDASDPATSKNSAMQATLASSILGSGDASGSISAFGASSASQAPAAIQSALTRGVAGFEFGDVNVNQNPIVTLAAGTGGVYFTSSGASKRQLEQLHADFSTWYEASWIPPIYPYDGRFRPISIHSLHKDLTVRSRIGYFAVSPAESSDILPFERPLIDVLTKSMLPSGVALHTAILHLGTLPDGNAAELIVQVPVSQLQVHDDLSTHISSVQAAIVALVRNSKGDVVQSFGEHFPLHKTPEMFRANPGQTITLERSFYAEPGTYTLETAVMDEFAKEAGARRSTFTIEQPPRGPSLSEITLVRSIEPLEISDGIFEPMRYLDGRVIPDIAADLPAGTSSLSLFLFLHPESSGKDQPSLRMQILRNGRLLAEVPMQLHLVSGTKSGIPYLVTMSGHSFSPGAYEVKAFLSQDGHTASSSVVFQVEDPLPCSTSKPSCLDNIQDLEPGPTDVSSSSEATTADKTLEINSVTNLLQAPPEAELLTMIEDARQRALEWSESLRNFSCLEVTNHFVDATGQEGWRHRGTLLESVKYVDHRQSRTVLSFNGETDVKPDQLKFAHSNGEFGSLLYVIFDPTAQAIFSWKQSSLLDGQPVQVFDFKVTRATSGYKLSDRLGHAFPVGFHGLLYLDPATRSVRRLSIVADDIPASLLVRASSVSIDYSWIAMQNHDFLLPVRGSVRLQETKRHPILNELEFRDYHRFGSEARILMNQQTPK